MSMSSEIVDTPFPAGALIPKAETNVLSFVQKYPQFNGRDVTIAIFDSGVDPRAAGLQTLCDGKTVKVIERYDCSGCGDVDTQKKVTADANGQIIGQSGRILKLTKEMLEANIANGEFRIGLKNSRDLCPTKVRECQMSRMKIKQWDNVHKTTIADVVRKINEFETENPDAKAYSWEKKLIKENLDSKLELLNNYEKMYADVEIAYDCILYATKDGWQAVIDTTEKGDLENALHIGEYSRTHELKNIDDFLSVSVNVHDNGDVLEIVSMCSAHGTHVASIASSNKSCSDVDGVAPNAKIVSLTIGDGRLGSMETGSALVRAMIKVMELCRSGRKVDVINMSYGEHSHWSNTGRIGELMNEVVNKYGVVWVVSAGNSGPALSTVGTPPDIGQTSLIGVGAYVSPQMMEGEYAMREKLPGNVYSWTSRDPCIDGGRAVTVCAPGGAIASVPQFTMAKSQLMNGTSMAAPHVAGAVALLISGLKQSGVEYSPFSIKRALSATATYLHNVDAFAQGHGLLNVEKAFEHLMTHKNEVDNMIRFSVRLNGGAKGIHIRDGSQKPQEFAVSIEPKYFNELDTAAENKYNFNVRLNLICTETFVQCGAFLDLNYGARNLQVKVDPSGLAPGAHSAFVRAYDTNCVQKGPLFEIPITVIQPHVLNDKDTRSFEPPTSEMNNGGITFQPNTIKRHFVMVPNNATWAVLRMQSLDKNVTGDAGKFFIHTMQLLPKKSCCCLELLKSVTISSESESTFTFKVEENNILELCIAKHWANFGNINIKYKLDFRGVKIVNPSSNIMHAARGIHRIELKSFIMEEVQPQFQLKNAVVVLRPTESKISPLTARDVVPEGRQIYQNVLTYNLSLSKAAEVALHAPLFNNILYEGEFESNLWMLFDVGKCLICSGDSFTEKSFRKLEKGDYLIKLQVRHEKREQLEKISETNMLASLRLASSFTFEYFDHYNQCLISGRKANSYVLRENTSKVYYLGPLSQEKLGKMSLPNNASWLTGTMSFAKDENGKRVDCQEFIYMLNPAADSNKKSNANNGNHSNNNNNKQQQQQTVVQQAATTSTATVGDGVSANNNGAAVESTTTNASPKKGKSSADDYIEALRDFQCSMINKCDLEKAESIYQDVLAAHPKYMPVHMNFIQNLEGSQPKAQYPLTFAKIASTSQSNQEEIDVNKTKVLMKRIADIAEIVIKETDMDSLFAYYGMKTDTRTDYAKIKTANDKQRTNLLEALAKRGIALCKYYILENSLKDHVEELDKIYLDILKFVDINDSKVLLFGLWHAYAHEHYGRMYKLLQKLQEEKRCREIYEELYLATKAMEYPHLWPVVRRRAISSYPGTYRNF